ncbi:YopX family protein [Macrococcoides caseolyticum]|uniref:YopX family protein n=1 Tax=Macrococcoides caseolyticum TaxID=69966 RepID=UPI000C33C05C|nr:YopX family protein [Macrococcus caseolyticus]PKE18674.1 hypothetical protein CW679_09725 [Macrococcus caseolyticus]PKF41676.1 hypothetical protein CW661_00640 [Macrococcus caseolyticus]
MIPNFRAWDKEDESWIDIKSLGMMEGEITTLEEWDDDLPYFIEDLGKTWELMQSTGLHDKNGKEIFEGDILHHPLQGMRKVYYPFLDTVASYGLENIENGMRNTLEDAHRVYEVIGNIYQHSHLLGNGGENL